MEQHQKSEIEVKEGSLLRNEIDVTSDVFFYFLPVDLAVNLNKSLVICKLSFIAPDMLHKTWFISLLLIKVT